MIKILRYGQVANSDIFARAVPSMNVDAVERLTKLTIKLNDIGGIV